MMTGWKAESTKQPPKVRGLSRYQKRRAKLSAAFAGCVLIVPTGHEKVRANDTCYHFRPGTDFYYLTGNFEPDCVLVFIPKARGKGHKVCLFAEPNPGRRDTTFFTDSQKGELWVGPRLGIAQSRVRYGVDACLPLADLPMLLAGIKRASPKHKVHLVRGMSARVDDAIMAHPERDKALSAHLSEMRLVKDALEIAALSRACASTRRGFEDIIKIIKDAQTEREVEGTFNLRARVEGNDVGYNTIAAAGAHACILHWSHNSGAIGARDLILVDAGVEGRELYTADVTRTLPVCGRFSRDQRLIYELVLEAQNAGLAAVKPGNDFMAPNRASMVVLAHGLEKLGILKSAQEALEPDKQWYRRYTLHNVSHMLGIDVHDCAQARQKTYRFGPLKPGMVLTVEPGLYFQNDDLTVPKRFRGIGVRIEDDVVVTKTGFRFLSELPRTCKDVEAWMRRVQGAKRAPFVIDKARL
jgi:Xaa-Pro aminopeptidase